MAPQRQACSCIPCRDAIQTRLPLLWTPRNATPPPRPTTPATTGRSGPATAAASSRATRAPAPGPTTSTTCPEPRRKCRVRAEGAGLGWSAGCGDAELSYRAVVPRLCLVVCRAAGLPCPSPGLPTPPSVWPGTCKSACAATPDDRPSLALWHSSPERRYTSPGCVAYATPSGLSDHPPPPRSGRAMRGWVHDDCTSYHTAVCERLMWIPEVCKGGVCGWRVVRGAAACVSRGSGMRMLVAGGAYRACRTCLPYLRTQKADSALPPLFSPRLISTARSTWGRMCSSRAAGGTWPPPTWCCPPSSPASLQT